MNAKILIVALCAFQLASGQDFITSATNIFTTTVLKPITDSLASTVNNGQQTLTSATQQLSSAFNSAVQQVPSLIQSAANNVQQFANSVNSTSAQIQAEVQKCVAQANQSLSGIQTNLTSQLQSQAASANASIQSAATSLANANAAYQNTFFAAVSNFSTCLRQGGLFSLPSCSGTLATTAAKTFSSAFNNAIQPFLQILGLSINSVTATVIPLVTSNVQQIQQTFQAYANQGATIAQQAEKCIEQAVTSAAAGANATATTATGAPN